MSQSSRRLCVLAQLGFSLGFRGACCRPASTYFFFRAVAIVLPCSSDNDINVVFSSTSRPVWSHMRVSSSPKFYRIESNFVGNLINNRCFDCLNLSS